MNSGNNRFPLDHGVATSKGVVPIRDADRSSLLYPSDLGYYDEPETDSFDFWSIVRIVLSRKWMILAITIVGTFASIAMTLRTQPLYMATASIEVQREEVQILEGANVGPTVIADSTYMETQYRLLRSRFLAERVAEDLNLANDPGYSNPNLPRDRRILQAARRIVGGVRVSPAGRSRVVNVTYISASPRESARIANAIVDAFIQSNLERKYNTTAFARQFLEERLATTKRALEESERRLVEYAETEDLLDLGAVAGNSSGGATLDENSIVILNAELSAAESERIKAEQAYLTAVETPPYRELLESPALRQLRQTRSELLTEYQDKLRRFKPDYPDMVSLQTRIDLIETEIEQESTEIVASISNDLKMEYEAAVAREESLRERVSELRSGLQDERNRRIEYRILQREVETVRSQYEALLQRSKEVSISSGIGSSNISVVDAALVPGRPFEPNVRRSAMQSLMLSLLFGVGLAFALNYIDDTIKTPEDVRDKLGLPAIGVIPKLVRKKDVVVDALNDPRSSISEAFASTRTALEFATEEGAPRSVLVTSTRPGEGKTSTTIAIATTFAKGGKNVLIIDGDMRKPSFVVDSRKSIGLSGLLTGHQSLSENIVRSKTAGLSILPSGIVPPNPAQLLSGPRLREIIETAEQMFDIVIIDSPPVMSFTDSPRLGSVVAASLIVVQSGLVRTPAARRTASQMYESRSNVIGAILTKFDAKKAGQDYSYYYSAYGSDGYAYVEGKGRKEADRKILIEAEVDGDESDESERWA